MAKSIRYQTCWEQEFSWLKDGKLKGYASCTLCKKDNIFFGTMGKSALTSHSKGKKHLQEMSKAKCSIPLKTFFSTTTASAENQPSASNVLANPTTSNITPVTIACETISTPTSASLLGPSAIQSSAQQKPLKDNQKWWMIKESVSKAEILWCIHTVMTHQSLRNAESSAILFRSMFPDSSIAKDMKLGKDKTSYSIVYGLAPYYKNNLRKTIEDCDFFVVGFDESMNKYAQKQQMDIVIRFWDKEKDAVSSRYFSSVFLTGTTSEKLLDALKQGIQGLDWKKILQLSMDGPNVNLKLLRLLKKEIEEQTDDGRKMIDIGSCGLHVAHVAFKTGLQKTGWNVPGFLRACYYLFKDSPSRRGIFMHITSSSKFPKKFCSSRWLENSLVAECALQLLPNLAIFVDHVKKSKDLKAVQSSGSFKTVAAALEDNLLRAKIAFFASLARDFEPFLKEFQSDSPMVPFLYENLINLLKGFMQRIVKEHVWNNQPLQKIDMDLKDNLKTAKDVDLGYATRNSLRQCSKVKDLDILKFREDIRKCLIHVCCKLMEKCPLKYSMTKFITFLDPKSIAKSQEDSISNMTKAMDSLVEYNLIAASVAQSADREFRSLVYDESTLLSCKHYDREQRLDKFWVSTLEGRGMDNLKKIVSLLLPLSHGNATLERGFSINGDIIVENLKEDSLIAQRLVHDTVCQVGGISNVLITKEMILSVKNANQRWKEALSEKKRKENEEDKTKAEKRKLITMAKELEEKKRKLLIETEKDVAAINEKLKELKQSNIV